MKKIMLTMLALLPAAVLAAPAEQQIVDLSGRYAPALSVRQATEKTYRWTVRNNGRPVDLTGYQPIMYWASNSLAGGIVPATVSWVDASNGIFTACFDPASLNATGQMMYAVGISSNAYTLAAHGNLRIDPDPLASGAPALQLSRSIIISNITWLGSFPSSAIPVLAYDPSGSAAAVSNWASAALASQSALNSFSNWVAGLVGGMPTGTLGSAAYFGVESFDPAGAATNAAAGVISWASTNLTSAQAFSQFTNYVAGLAANMPTGTLGTAAYASTSAFDASGAAASLSNALGTAAFSAATAFDASGTATNAAAGVSNWVAGAMTSLQAFQAFTNYVAGLTNGLVYTNDQRLTNARPPEAHNHSFTAITNAPWLNSNLSTLTLSHPAMIEFRGEDLSQLFTMVMLEDTGDMVMGSTNDTFIYRARDWTDAQQPGDYFATHEWTSNQLDTAMTTLSNLVSALASNTVALSTGRSASVGESNDVVGPNSMALGKGCKAYGRNSFAGGQNAVSTNDAAFVWAATSQNRTNGFDHGDGSFSIYAPAGVWIGQSMLFVDANGFVRAMPPIPNGGDGGVYPTWHTLGADNYQIDPGATPTWPDWGEYGGYYDWGLVGSAGYTPSTNHPCAIYWGDTPGAGQGSVCSTP